MPTKITMGVRRERVVTDSSARKPALMKPVASATPMPSIATSTTPSGWNLTKVSTIADMKPVSDSPDSMLTTASGLPVRGSTAANSTVESTADNTATSAVSSTNNSAGSGSLLPIRSTPSSTRSRRVRGRAAASVVMALALRADRHGRGHAAIELGHETGVEIQARREHIEIGTLGAAGRMDG